MVVQGLDLVQKKMADCNGGAAGDERRSIVGNKHKKYGSTSSLMQRCEIVKHVVQPGETLQGIALRYRVTTEQIRRANRIWTNDSLFLRSTLDVPVPRPPTAKLSWDDDMDDVQLSVASTPSLSFSYEHSGAALRSNGDGSRAGTSRQDSEGSGENCDQPLISGRTEGGLTSVSLSNEPTFNDIFLRIDTSIAQSRTQADRRERLHESYDGCSPGSPPPVGSSRRNTAHRARMRNSLEQQRREASEEEEEVTPRVTVHPVTVTQGRKVQSSLQRIQRQQDEIFEL